METAGTQCFDGRRGRAVINESWHHTRLRRERDEARADVQRLRVLVADAFGALIGNCTDTFRAEVLKEMAEELEETERSLPQS